jgi:hypothetical protein
MSKASATKAKKQAFILAEIKVLDYLHKKSGATLAEAGRDANTGKNIQNPTLGNWKYFKCSINFDKFSSICSKMKNACENDITPTKITASMIRI